MNKNDFLSALKEFADGCNAELVSKGNDWHELKLRDYATPRMYLLKPNMTPSGNDVSEIHYRILCGEVEVKDPNTLATILRRNYGGVMATEFFFSGTLVGERFYLFLETRLSIDADIEDKEEVFGILGTMWLHPLFTVGWDFPEGVVNYLW
jgi:hypothetical protein